MENERALPAILEDLKHVACQVEEAYRQQDWPTAVRRAKQTLSLASRGFAKLAAIADAMQEISSR